MFFGVRTSSFHPQILPKASPKPPQTPPCFPKLPKKHIFSNFFRVNSKMLTSKFWFSLGSMSKIVV